MPNIQSMSNYQIYRRLSDYFSTYRLLITLVLFGTIITAIIDSFIPVLIKLMLDSMFVSRNYDSIQLIPLIFIVLFVVRNLSSYFYNYGANWICSNLTVDLQTKIFSKLLILPIYHYTNQTSEDFISKLTSEITLFAQDGLRAVIAFVKNLIVAMGLMTWMFYLNWEMTLLTLMVASIILLSSQLIYSRSHYIDQKKDQITENLIQIIRELTKNHRTVILDGGRQNMYQRFQDEANQIKQLNLKDNKINIFRVPLIYIIVAIALSTIFYFFIEQAIANTTSIGSFVSYIIALLILSMSINHLIKTNKLLQNGLATTKKIVSTLDLETESSKEGITLNSMKGEIKFECTSYYTDPKKSSLLKDFSLTIRPNEKVAIVGSSDVINDVLINLLLRFILPTNGRLFLDGHELTTINLDSLRSKFGLLLQEAVIFNDSIAANIAYGKMRHSTESEIISAAHTAHATEFIRKMPRGMQTLLGKKGVKLSREQRQHIVIARTLLKNPPLLILDETATAQDDKSEDLMQSALNNLMLNRTVIIFARRKVTLEKSDRIIVLDHNRIIDTGKHQELILKKGIYAELYSRCY